MIRGRERLPGDRIGAFEIVRHLASGGMGDVYEARETERDEPAALKFLGDASPLALARFEREARIAASLSHPHIIAIRGQGTAPDGTAYIAMELLDGIDLYDYLRRQRMSSALAVELAIQVCAGLQHAHARRIVHRDLKPQNIFMCGRGALNAKLLDFGIARITDDASSMTASGSIVGTWSYMSPEQARGERDIDHRTDLWSLGVVLYECLAGRLPFEAGSGPGTLCQILLEAPVPLGWLRPDLPSGLVEIVHRALSKSRDDRYGSSAEMSAAIASIDPAMLSMRQSARPAGDAVSTGAATQAQDTIPAGIGIDDATVESRLSSVVFLRAVRDPLFVRDLALEVHGRVVSLIGDDLLVAFGADRWNGDEPNRAVRLAIAAAVSCRAIGVATGRALRGAANVAGAVVDSAVELSQADGIHLDATTARSVRDVFVVETQPDGSARLDPQAQRNRVAPAVTEFATAFVGREFEIAMLLNGVEAVGSNVRPGGMVVLGASGIGKSRLRYEAAAQLRIRDASATWLIARCEAARRDAPFAALHDALADSQEPALGNALSIAAHSGDPQSALDRVRASLETILRGLAERGTVILVVDDAQWLDASSRAAIRWVFENASDLPLAVWCFASLEARDTVLEAVPGATLHELGLLPKPLAEKLLRSVAPGAPAEVLDRAGGHPLFLEELGKLFVERGPASLVGALPLSIEGAHLAQLDRLAVIDREFLKRASVFGRTFWIEGAAHLGGDPEAAPRLKRATMLVPQPRSRLEGAHEMAFRSALLQEVTYALWPEAQRARHHGRVAEWLSPRTGVTPDELARHWDRAGDAPRAAAAYVAAAEATAQVSDAATSCALVQRALELTNDPALRWRALVAQDTALQFSGNRDAQRAGLFELDRLALSLGPLHQAEAAWRRCYFARFTSDPDAALVHGTRALQLAMEVGADRWIAAAHNELTLLFADEGRFEAAREHARSGRELAARIDDAWLRARAAATMAYVEVECGGRTVDALEMYERAAALYASAGDRRREAVVLVNSGFAMVRLGRTTEALDRFDAAIALSKRVGNARSVAVATQNRGTVFRMLGDVTRARSDFAFASLAAERANHVLLAAAVAVERIYLALSLPDRDGSELLSLAAEAQRLTLLSRSPGLVASGRASALRAIQAAGATTAADIDAARALVPALDTQFEGRAELLLAIHLATGVPGDLVEASDAIAAFVARTATAEEAGACRDAFRRKYLVPDSIAAG